MLIFCSLTGSWPWHERTSCNTMNLIKFYEPGQILVIGLKLIGYLEVQQARVKAETNLERFKQHFGSDPIVLSVMWEDMMTTDDEYAYIEPKKAKIIYFLWAHHFLYRYPTESQRASRAKVCDTTIRNWCWYFVYKMQALKASKIVWPEEWTVGNPRFDADKVPFFPFTVDGIHTLVYEPWDYLLSKNPKYYSHKSDRPALNYELGIAVHENRLVWVNGPFPASMHDITIFRKELKDKVPPGSKAIGDKGYIGEAAVISCPNSLDSKEVRAFQGRARARHESFNGRLKHFGCLAETFCHPLEKHVSCFETVCVIVQYQMELGSPLFDT